MGAAEIDEWRAYEDSQIAELSRCVESLGMRALYFDGTESFFMVDYKTYYDQPEFRTFWQQVARLEIPVLWHLRCRIELSPPDFANELQIFRAFVEEWPDINFVVTHCFRDEPLRKSRHGIRPSLHRARTALLSAHILPVCSLRCALSGGRRNGLGARGTFTTDCQ